MVTITHSIAQFFFFLPSLLGLTPSPSRSSSLAMAHVKRKPPGIQAITQASVKGASKYQWRIRDKGLFPRGAHYIVGCWNVVEFLHAVKLRVDELKILGSPCISILDRYEVLLFPSQVFIGSLI